MSQFNTRSQIEYAKSIVHQRVHEAMVRDLQDMASDFNRATRGNLLRLTMEVKASPIAPSYYKESDLETDVKCSHCNLQYSVYGVFAFCPDCRQHNSLQILDKNLEVVGKMLDLAAAAESEVADRLIENALEDCVSALDGFGRETCRVHAHKSSDRVKTEKVSFQNLEGAKQSLIGLLGIDLAACLSLEEWRAAVRALQKRHILSHKMGVVDQEYIDKSGDLSASVGHRITAEADEVRSIIQTIRKLATHLSEGLERLPNRP